MSKRIFSGIQPSGNLHLGNYLGALKHWVRAQDDENENIFCIVDLHAITVPREPKVLRANTKELAALFFAAGLDPNVACVASLFISRWDVAVQDKIPQALRNRLGIAIAMRTYKAYCDLLVESRWQKLAEAGARPQRLLWASTGTKDPAASDILYINALAAPGTINTMPEKTLLAFADHGVANHTLPHDSGDAEVILAEFAQSGIDDVTLAAQLQREGVQSFANSWRDLLDRIEAKSAVLTQTHT